MLQEIAAFIAICLTFTVIVLGCEKKRKPPTDVKQAKTWEIQEIPNNKLELSTSKTRRGSKNESDSKRIKKSSKTLKLRTKEKKSKQFIENEMAIIPPSVNQDNFVENTPQRLDLSSETPPQLKITAARPGKATSIAAAPALEGTHHDEPETAKDEKKEDEAEETSRKKHNKKHKKHHQKNDDNDDEKEKTKKRSKRSHKKKKKHHCKKLINNPAPDDQNVDKSDRIELENYSVVIPNEQKPPGSASKTQLEEQLQQNVVAAGSAASTVTDCINNFIAKNEIAAAPGNGQVAVQQDEEKSISLFVAGVPDDARQALEKKFEDEATKRKRPAAKEMKPVLMPPGSQPKDETSEIIQVSLCGTTDEIVAKSAAAMAEIKGSITDLQPECVAKNSLLKELIHPAPLIPSSSTTPSDINTKPRVIPRDPKAERIAKFNLKQENEAYPTMNDVLSDWSSTAEPVLDTEKAAQLKRTNQDVTKKDKEEEAREAQRYNEEQEMKLRKEEEAASEKHRKKCTDAAVTTRPYAPRLMPQISTSDEKNEEMLPLEKQAEIDRVKKLREFKPKPKPIKRSSWEEKLASGKAMRGESEYPTFGDIVSDWDDVTDDKDRNKQNY